MTLNSASSTRMEERGIRDMEREPDVEEQDGQRVRLKWNGSISCLIVYQKVIFGDCQLRHHLYQR